MSSLTSSSRSKMEDEVEEYLRCTDRILIFGYGSLLWRPSFEFVSKQIVFCDGWWRRFWQGSPDHRGTPDYLGRVVTMVPAPPDQSERTFGIVYEIANEQRDSVLAYLDDREKAGFSRAVVDTFALRDGVSVPMGKALLYMATEDNEHFMPAEPLEHMAHRIARATGESGPNRDYLFNLAAALREMCVCDEHVFELESATRKLLAE